MIRKRHNSYAHIRDKRFENRISRLFVRQMHQLMFQICPHLDFVEWKLRRDVLAAQESELTGVGHGVGEGALEHDFGGDAVEFGAEIDVVSYVGEDLVEVRYGGGEVRQRWRLVSAS